jgi:tRNA(Ile)-lysidine synthase TilS/MesJ
MTNVLPTSLMTSMLHTIEQHDLIDRSRPVLVALSGGKDSLLLCLALRELGIAHHAVTIDMGYEVGWADRIRQRAHAVGVTTQIVSARESHGGPGPDAVTVRRGLKLLDTIAVEKKPVATPCTYCYSVKVLLLEAAAARSGASQVAFAHHMTDAAASLLKEALLHVDRFDRRHSRYDRENFESLVAELATAAEHYDADCDQPILRAIEALVSAGRVGTDEPPRQPLRQDFPENTEVVRPFFGIDEDTIIRAVTLNKVQTESSGCGHGLTLATQTPREMVHYRVLAGRGGSAFFNHVADLVRRGIAEDGTSTTRARMKRQELLGQQYKPVISEIDKL